MKAAILSLRLNRRAMGAAVLADDRLAFIDGRHLTSKRERANAAIARYLRRVLELTQPRSVVIDAPATEGSSTRALLHTVHAVLKEAHLDVRAETVGEVLQAYGVPRIKSRQ